MKMTISVCRYLKRKTMLVWVKEYINKIFDTCKSLYNLLELHTAFREKHPNVNTGFSMFCVLRPKWCVLTGSKMTHSVCVCSAHRNVVLLVDAMDYDLTWKNQIKLTFSGFKYFHWNLFAITFISPHSQEYFFNWNITSSPYLEMLLISLIKLLFLFFLSDRNVPCCFL